MVVEKFFGSSWEGRRTDIRRSVKICSVWKRFLFSICFRSSENVM